MKLSDYANVYDELSGKASDVARQLAFAGLALVWLFRESNGKGPSLPSPLLTPAALLVGALTADLLQYISATAIWGTFHRYHERRLNDRRKDPELDASPFLNWPANSLFALKLIFTGLAYVLILLYVSRLWFATTLSV